MANATPAQQSNDRAQFDSLLPALQVDRRGFIVTALGAGFALAVQPSAAQSPIKTSSEGLTAGSKPPTYPTHQQVKPNAKL